MGREEGRKVQAGGGQAAQPAGLGGVQGHQVRGQPRQGRAQLQQGPQVPQGAQGPSQVPQADHGDPPGPQVGGQAALPSGQHGDLPAPGAAGLGQVPHVDLGPAHLVRAGHHHGHAPGGRLVGPRRARTAAQGRPPNRPTGV